MVWKRKLPLNMAIFGIYVRFLGWNFSDFSVPFSVVLDVCCKEKKRDLYISDANERKHIQLRKWTQRDDDEQ